MSEFVSLITLLTDPAVAIAITTMIAAGFSYVSGSNPKWMALVVAMVLMVGGYLVQVVQYENVVLDWAQLFMQVIYGFGVFFSAAGLSAAGASLQGMRMSSRGLDYTERGLTHWF